jgi:hypothetical protein
MERLPRLELGTSTLATSRSSNLSYNRKKEPPWGIPGGVDRQNTVVAYVVPTMIVS